MVGFAALRRAFAQQRLVLRGVQEARLGIGAFLLPAPDGVAGRVVELSVDPGAEAESGPTALHVATVVLAQADPICSSPVGQVGEGRRVDGRRRLARGGVQTRLGRIRAADDSQDRQCEDQGAHGPCLTLKSIDDSVFRGTPYRPELQTFRSQANCFPSHLFHSFDCYVTPQCTPGHRYQIHPQATDSAARGPRPTALAFAFLTTFFHPDEGASEDTCHRNGLPRVTSCGQDTLRAASGGKIPFRSRCAPAPTKSLKIPLK